MVSIPIGYFMAITGGSFAAGAIVSLVLLKMFDPKLVLFRSPFKKVTLSFNTHDSYSSADSKKKQRSILSEPNKAMVTFRSELGYYPQVHEIVRDLRGEEVYSNRDISPQIKHYEIVKAKIPKDMMYSLYRDSPDFHYVLDIVVDTEDGSPSYIKKMETYDLNGSEGQLYGGDQLLPRGSGHSLNIGSSGRSIQYKDGPFSDI
jgi:hypothetical protein